MRHDTQRGRVQTRRDWFAYLAQTRPPRRCDLCGAPIYFDEPHACPTPPKAA